MSALFHIFPGLTGQFIDRRLLNRFSTFQVDVRAGRSQHTDCDQHVRFGTATDFLDFLAEFVLVASILSSTGHRARIHSGDDLAQPGQCRHIGRP